MPPSEDTSLSLGYVSGRYSQERLTRSTVISKYPSGRARCGASAGCSATRYQSLYRAVAERQGQREFFTLSLSISLSPSLSFSLSLSPSLSLSLWNALK